MKKKIASGWNYLSLALYAFGALGLEALLAYLIEPMLYGAEMAQWSVWQNVCHWVMTCILWGIVFIALTKLSKNKYNFDLFQKAESMKLWQWITVVICIAFTLTVSYLDWHGSKVLKEYQANGLIKFIFQYIYYFFETGLFMLIIIFAQKSFELWFKNENIPYGGVIVALTWGLAHIFTKGSIWTGLTSALAGFIFGVIYLLVNRDIKKTFLLLLIMFVL